MKTIFALIICFGLIVIQNINADSDEDRLMKYKDIEKECEKQYNVTIDGFFGLDSIERNDLSDETKCFVKCLFEKSNTFIDGQIAKEEVLKEMESSCIEPEHFHKDKAEALINKCVNVEASNDCDYVVNYMACIIQDAIGEAYCIAKE